MKTIHLWLKQITNLGLILMMGASMNADAGWFGFGGDSWKEEVLLHDGRKIIIERSQSYGGRREVGQGAPIREHSIKFELPGSGKTLEWKSEYSEDVGRANFNLLALHILKGTPYIVADPNLCLAYNKWGRPNPPYVLFKHDGKAWQRIQMSELPVEFKTINVSLDIRGRQVEELVEIGKVSAEQIKQRNAHTEIPHFKTILREPYAGAAGSCEPMVPYGKGGWLGMDWFKDQPTYEACLRFCEAKGVSKENCPCATLFKGAK